MMSGPFTYKRYLGRKSLSIKTVPNPVLEGSILLSKSEISSLLSQAAMENTDVLMTFTQWTLLNYSKTKLPLSGGDSERLKAAHSLPDGVIPPLSTKARFISSVVGSVTT
jgi:hypothetical protein